MLNEEITLAELEIHDSKLEELDLEAALNLRRMGWATPRHFGFNARSIKNSDSKKVLFPNGLVFDSESYRTAETRLVFSYLREISEGKSSLASRTGIEPVSPP